MWGSSVLSLFRSEPLRELKATNERLKATEAKLAELEREMAARTVEWTELAKRMASAAKRASGALGGRPRKSDDDDDDGQLDAMQPVIDRERRRRNILNTIRRQG